MIFTGDIALPYIGSSSFTIPEELQSKVWVGNLEGSLIYDKKEGVSGVYNDVKAIDELIKQIPFKAFGIANNHLLDAADVKTTIGNVERLNVGVVGGGRNLQEAGKPLLLTDVDGTTYRILSFGWEIIQCITATKNKQGVNPYTKGNVLRCVESALRNNEPVVCFFHWNYELEAYPQPYDRQLAMELIDMGVCAVIGCHAHRTQPVEFYKGRPIVYGLGNFLFCQGYYFGGKLSFPKFCEEEYAFEITKEGYKLHCFHYNQQENRLDYVKNIEVGEVEEFEGKAVFSGYSERQYEKFFKENRVQRKLLPIFHAKESALSYAIKSKWIKMRGGLINLLTKVNLKSANRADR